MTTVAMRRGTSARVVRHDCPALNFNDCRLALILDNQLKSISPNEDPPARKTLTSPEAKREMAPLLEIAVLLQFRGQTVRQSIATELARTRGNANKPYLIWGPRSVTPANDSGRRAGGKDGATQG